MKKSQAAAARAALGAHLQPQLAQDGALPKFRALFAKPVTVARLAEDAAKAFPEADPEALAKALQFALDEADKDDKAEDEDEDEKDKKAEDEDDDDDPDTANDEDDEKVDKKAMDAALKAAVGSTIKRMNAIRAAEEDVRPLIGAVVAQDSAEAVYKLALDHLQVDAEGVHPSAYRSLVQMHKTTAIAKPIPRIALDAKANDDFASRYPTAGKLKRG